MFAAIAFVAGFAVGLLVGNAQRVYLMRRIGELNRIVKQAQAAGEGE